MASSLKEKTARGLLWGAIDNGGMQLVGLIFGIVLGRLLTPGDYGMMAMIAIFSVIANALQESGLGRAIVNLEQPTDRDCNSVFWFNIAVAVSCYVLFFFLAPVIARYYHEPRLVPLCRYAFLSFVLSAPGVVQSALMQKRLLVKQRTKANLTAVLASSLLGSVMAWQGFGYWALATQTNTYILLNTIFYWRIAGWRPSLSFDPEPVRRMFRFGCKILASTVITQINNNVLNILLGHYFSARATGLYNQAYQWNSKVIYLLQGMLGAVTQPVMVNLRDNPLRQLAALRKLVRFTAFLSFPLVLGFGLVAHEFILITLTEKWIQSASYLEILCIGGAFLPISTLLSDFIISQGRSGVYLGSTVALGLLQIVSMTVLYPLGIRTMIVGAVALNIVWTFVWLLLGARTIGYRLLSFLRDTVPFGVAAALVMVATGWATSPLQAPWALLLSRIVLAALLYYVVMRVAGAKILQECMDFVLRRKTKEAAGAQVPSDPQDITDTARKIDE